MHIDWWTLGIQTANVAILIWLLQHFFWRPVAGMIEQRRAGTAATLAQAKALDDKAKAALADVERTRAGFAAERDGILKQAHEAASLADAATLADTGRKVAALQASAAGTIATEAKTAEAAWAARASRLAVDIAARLAARLEGPAVQARFLAWLLEQLHALPVATRQATDGAPIEVVTATPIDADGQARTTGLIAEALGAAPVLTYRTDPSLIAGLELHGAHLVVTNSWQADLDAILVEAGHDDQS